MTQTSIQASMLDLFNAEVETQVNTLTAGLLKLERNPTAADSLESCMRAAHCLKGAARIVGIHSGIAVAHAMEDLFVRAQRAELSIDAGRIDVLLKGVDLLQRIAATALSPPAERAATDEAVAAFPKMLEGGAVAGAPALPPATASATPATAAEALLAATAAAPIPELKPVTVQATTADLATADEHGRLLRVTAENLNRLLGLAGESLVESRRLRPLTDSLLRVKRMHRQLQGTLEQLQDIFGSGSMKAGQVPDLLAEARRRTEGCQQLLTERLEDLDAFERRATRLSHGLYEGALSCRMRPFADGTKLYPRMMRDLARSLGKQVRLEILGATTEVDRDILEKLDSPIGHLLRNAVDHAIEAPDKRVALGKPAEGRITLTARHSFGRLLVIVADDGKGIDVEALRETIVKRNLAPERIAERLSEAELFEFLLLPGFSTAETVTDISGRGVGLDVVHDVVRQLQGSIRIQSQLGKGTEFHLQLPLTLSVIRALLVDVDSQPYALPLATIVRTVMVPTSSIQHTEGRQWFAHDGRQVGLVTAHQVLNGTPARVVGDELSVIVLGEHGHHYGLVVDRFLGERELVVQPLDVRLGKVKDIAAGSLMEDGSPVLIFDVDDLVRSIEKLCASGRPNDAQGLISSARAVTRKRVLVVDDSLTVRELERKLLVNSGYEVDVAVDGMDGWNAIRNGSFDLVITDIDMPRLDGIELVKRVKTDPKVRATPIMIVSYKDRPEDRERGLTAGADHYLAKSSFHDETLVTTVIDLIGTAT